MEPPSSHDGVIAVRVDENFLRSKRRERDKMNTTYGLRNLAVAISFGAVVAMSGCGGGSGTRPDAEGAAATGGATGTTSGATGTTGGATSMPSGAAGSLAALLPNASNAFTPLVQALRGNATGQTAELASRFSVKSVSSDGNNGFRVTYTVDGQEETIHFEATDYVDGGSYYSKDVDGVAYFLGTYTGSFERTDKNQGSSGFRYFDVNDFGTFDGTTNTADRNFMSYGAPTDSADLPAGAATFVGFANGRSRLKVNGSNDYRLRIDGSLRLTADFGDSTLTGAILGIRVRNATGGDSYLPDTAYFDISNGRIADGKFTADLAGVQPGSGAPADESVRGYEGTVDGQFYGPAAEEVAGVFNASRQNRVMAGVFGASRLEPRVSGLGLSRSPATPVHATNTDDFGDLFDTGVAFGGGVASAIRYGLWPSQPRVALVDNAYVKTIADNGSDGVLVTYVVDGKEQTVDFLETDFLEDGSFFETATESHSLWDYSGWFEDNPQYTYLSLNGFYALDPGTPGTRMRVAWGARTPAANLPVGTATYGGTMNADVFQQGNSSALRNRLDGSLNLTADFTQSSIEGTITDLVIRRYDDSRTREDLPASTHIAITNGQITDGQFTASLTGMDTNAAAPLRESVRGFEGGVIGDFYGPAAEEVGGVLSARRDEDLRLMTGTFGGTQQ